MAELRLMTAADSSWARAQMERERWSSYGGWIHAHVTHDPDGCFVAEIDGEPAGMVTSTAFAQTGWIGNLIVTPEHRRAGLGSLLMATALDRLRATGLETIRIDADPPGMSIYRQLGFEPTYESLRFWSRDLRGAGHAGVRPMTPADTDAVLAFDRPRFGDDRGRFLRLVQEISAHGLVLEQDGIAGYTFVVPTQDGVQLGPTVATDSGVARALIESAAHLSGASALVTGIPATNHAGCSLLRGLGFSDGAPSLRMVLGDPSGVREVAGSIFAIASGACG